MTKTAIRGEHMGGVESCLTSCAGFESRSPSLCQAFWPKALVGRLDFRQNTLTRHHLLRRRAKVTPKFGHGLANKVVSGASGGWFSAFFGKNFPTSLWVVNCFPSGQFVPADEGAGGCSSGGVVLHGGEFEVRALPFAPRKGPGKTTVNRPRSPPALPRGRPRCPFLPWPWRQSLTKRKPLRDRNHSFGHQFRL